MTAIQQADRLEQARASRALWQVPFKAAPDEVFRALVSIVAMRGRLCAVEDFGSSLVFTPARSSRDVCTELRVSVITYGTGSLVSLGQAQPMSSPTSVAVEAEVIGKLIHHLRDHLASSTSA